MGQLIRRNGCKFYWDDEQGASLTLRDGRVVHLEVKDDVPVMTCPARYLRDRRTSSPWPERPGSLPHAFERVLDLGPELPRGEAEAERC